MRETSRTQNFRQVSGYRTSSRPANSVDPGPPCECYVRGKTDYIAKNINNGRVKAQLWKPNLPSAISSTSAASTGGRANAMQFLDSDSDGSVSVLHVTDHESHLRRVLVDIAGVGLID